MKPLDMLAWILLVIGGLNWGLIGIFQFNLVGAIFGEAGFISRLIYIIVGLAAVYAIISMKAKCCPKAESSSSD